MVETAAEAEAGAACGAAQATSAETMARIEGMEPKAMEMTEREEVKKMATEIEAVLPVVASMTEARWAAAVLNRSRGTSR